MKKIIFILIFCILCVTNIPNLSIANPSPIILESKILSLIDGSFMNADRIEEIKRFQFKLSCLLLGDHLPDGSYKGRYLYQNTYHTIQTLQALEEKLSDTKPLAALLEQGKEDFIKISNEFRESAPGAKPFTIILIEESCKKRNRLDSVLLTWAHTTPESENTVFKKEITSFEKLDTFLTDLFNFFTDLNVSCPKAQSMFHDRFAKFKAIKKLLPSELKKINRSVDQMAFFSYIKNKHLESLLLTDITPKTIQKLLAHFITHESSL